MSGLLTLVATPIGNLDDLSPRALKALRDADLLLCEDTRRTGNLCRRFGVDTPRQSFHAHNEAAQVEAALARLRRGERLALVSDAGTPLLNDPGFGLVRAAIAAGLPVTTAPGPAAPIVALVLSGFPAVPFAFFGFPPPRPGGRKEFAATVADWPHAAVCFLSPHRGAAELAALAEAMGERPAALARELTKLHESLTRGTLRSLAATVAETPPKGEWTLVIGPADSPAQRADADELATAALARAAAGESLKSACQELADAAGVAWRPVYKAALARDDA